MASEHPLCREKTDGGLEKRLANQRSASRIAKKPHVSRGQETKWEIPVNNGEMAEWLKAAVC